MTTMKIIGKNPGHPSEAWRGVAVICLPPAIELNGEFKRSLWPGMPEEDLQIMEAGLGNTVFLIEDTEFDRILRDHGEAGLRSRVLERLIVESGLIFWDPARARQALEHARDYFKVELMRDVLYGEWP